MRPGVGTGSLDTVFFNVSQEVAMLFRVARVALCDIPYVSEGMCVRNRRGTKVAVSTEEAELHTVHSTLDTPHFTLYTPQVALDTLHSRLYTPHVPLHNLHSRLLTLHFT